MKLNKHIALAPICVALLATLSTVVSTPVAVAQERRSDRDDDDRRDSDDRRERFRRGRDRGEDGDRDGDENRADSKTSEKTSSSDDIALTTKSWATTFVQQHDKNKNSWLDGDELRSAGRRAEAADANHDKIVTIDELVASTMKGASTTSSAAAAPAAATSKSSDDDDNKSEDRDRGGFFGFSRDRGRDSEGERSGDESKSGATKRVYTGTIGVGKAGGDEKNTRRTYRFAPAGERLPTGLPSWFESRDKNGDGQVLMSEYSRSWSSRMVAEFRRYDANDDGVITAKEVVKK